MLLFSSNLFRQDPTHCSGETDRDRQISEQQLAVGQAETVQWDYRLQLGYRTVKLSSYQASTAAAGPSVLSNNEDEE